MLARASINKDRTSNKSIALPQAHRKRESDMNLRHGRPLFVHEDIDAWFLSDGVQENLNPISS